MIFVAAYLAHFSALFLVAVGYRSAPTRHPRFVLVSCFLAGALAVAAGVSQLPRSPSPIVMLFAIAIMLELGISQLVASFVRGSPAVLRVLSGTDNLQWAGGQATFPTPANAGFQYRSAGLLLLPLAFFEFTLIGLPLVLLFFSVGTPTSLEFDSLLLALTFPLALAHAVVVGALFRIVHWSLFSRAA